MFGFLRKLFGVEKVPATGERARNEKGHYVADDPSTPNVNEAYVDGKTPTKKKATRKKAATKKAATKKKATTRKKAAAKK